MMLRYEGYRESGADWLGEIPSQWGMKRLKYSVKLNNQKTPCVRADEYVGLENIESWTGKNIPGSQDVPPESQTNAFQKNDVLFGKLRPYLAKVWLADRNGYSSTELLSLRAHEYLPGYLKYLCISKLFIDVVDGSTFGSKMPRADWSFIGNLGTPIPTKNEQSSIISFLDQKTSEIDTAIAKKERLIELLQEQEDILISQAVTRGVNPNVPMRDSGVAWIGQVPAHWKQLANRALFRERMEPGQADLPILSVSIHTAVSDEEQNGTENIRAKIRIEDKTSYKRVRPGDVTYNMMRAWQGAIGVVRVDGLVSPAYVVAAPLATINGAYFEYLYRTHGFIREMDRYSKGITDFRKRLYWDEFKQLVSLLPPLDEQIQIAAYAEQVINQTSALTEKIRGQIDALNEFRASLIENLVTGKIKV